MSYETELAAWGRAADTEVATLTAELEAARNDDTTDDQRILELEAALLAKNLEIEELVEEIGIKQEVINSQATTILNKTNRITILRDKLNECRGTTGGTGFLVGSSLGTNSGETKYESFKRREADWGVAPEVVRYFNSGLPSTFPSFDDAVVINSFKVPIIGGKIDIVGTLAGKYDATFRRYFASARAGVTEYWSFWHEIEDDVEDGRVTIKGWKDAFQHIYNISQEYKDTKDLKVGVILMGWTTNPKSGRTLSNYKQNFPVDFIGWDVYPNPEHADTVNRFKMCADGAKNVLGVNNYMICETGANNKSHDDQVIADHVIDAVETAIELGYSMYMYYDAGDPGNPSWDSRLLTDTQHDAMAYAINNY